MGVGGWFDDEGRALPKWAMRRSLTRVAHSIEMVPLRGSGRADQHYIAPLQHIMTHRECADGYK